ncbi:hypothetical protein QYE76_051891 [Lolium multiflorum]|uniref:CCHC-type domain-containing protein n=1 Tax=Lolium multiflorum TaxID=4521 RepID=A0AAD8SSN9_LOLMU|nr:hypothetical protein QYE76_051891 [Lolium multiflorum]
MVSEHVIPKDMASPINFNQFLEKEKLKSNGSNFTDWFRHVRIFLNGGNLQYVLDAPLGDPPAETETDEVKNVYMTRKTRYSQVRVPSYAVESDLQKRFEHHDPHELMKELKTIFETHAAVECYEASKHFFSCMMEEGSSISEHMLVMTGHAKKLSDLGIVIPNRLGINRVLQSLPPSYKNFVMNYNMQNMNKEFPELFGMLKAAEIEIKKEHQVLMVNKTTSFKKQGKSKGKFKKGGKKAATPPMKPKNGPKPDADCYYCKEKGHWKRNCSKYLADLKSGLIKKKKEATEPRRSTRDRATPDWYDPCLNVMIVDNNDEDPATYEEAMMSPDSNKWQEAMKSEMGSMYDNKVWTLVDLPDSRKAVENKWIFKRKTDADGNITVYKARLVAKGFRQIQGVDYDETFSPVAKLKSATHSGTPGGTSGQSSAATTSTSASEMAEEPVKYEDLPPEHKKRYDELKAILEADLIGAFEKTRSHGIKFKGFQPEGALDGLDLSLPSDERTRALRQEVNYAVAHSLHRHYESLVNTLERVALNVVQEVMKHKYSLSGPALGTHQGEIPLYTRPPLQHTFAAPHQQGSPAYVVYKVGGDPGDYQFLYEPPKEIPHGYVCTYVPDCNDWMTQVTAGRTPRQEGSLEQSSWSRSTPTVDEITAIMRDQFGILPKKRMIGYSKPYPNEYDLIPLPPKYRLPDFTKFSGSKEPAQSST